MHTDEDLILFLDRELGVKPDDVNSDIRSEIARYAANGFEPKT